MNTLYLAFDGFTGPQFGAQGGQSISTPAFAVPAAIPDILSQVKAAFAAFDLDVTTTQPTSGIYGVMAVGGSWSDWYGIQSSGSTFINGWGMGLRTGYVFAANTLANNPLWVARGICHEAGHLFGLQHQALWQNGQLVSEYGPGMLMGDFFSGTPGWVVGKDQYGQTQDDVAILTVALGAATVTSTATYVGSDVISKGDWQTHYGSDGYSLAQGSASLPPYASVSVIGNANYVWTPSTADVRGLKKPNTQDRLAACWYGGSFNIAVNLSDGLEHLVTLYCVDWDTANTRHQRIDVLDAATQVVLDSRDVVNFTPGQYLSWSVKGNVIFRCVNLAPASSSGNSVVSGLFFGGVSTPPSDSMTLTLGGITKHYSLTETP